MHRVSAVLVAFVAILGMTVGVGAATPGDSELNREESARSPVTDFPLNGSEVVAETATGHGDEVRGTLTSGDREAHTVRPNERVPGENDDSPSEELPGVTNVAAGTNLTVATSHGEDVKEVAITYENNENASVAPL